MGQSLKFWQNSLKARQSLVLSGMSKATCLGHLPSWGLLCALKCWHPLQDTNVVLAISRIMVAWQPVGLAMGVYDMANRYLRQREQFGNPLAAYQVGRQADQVQITPKAPLAGLVAPVS